MPSMKAIAVCMVLLSLLHSGCLSPTLVVYLGERVRVPLGKTLTLRGEDFSLTFRDVLEDSRCPQGVECFFEGRVLVLLEIQKKELVVEIQPSKLPLVVLCGSYCVTISTISPLRLSLEPPRREEYALTLQVTYATPKPEKARSPW